MKSNHSRFRELILSSLYIFIPFSLISQTIPGIESAVQGGFTYQFETSDERFTHPRMPIENHESIFVPDGVEVVEHSNSAKALYAAAVLLSFKHQRSVSPNEVFASLSEDLQTAIVNNNFILPRRSFDDYLNNLGFARITESRVPYSYEEVKYVLMNHGVIWVVGLNRNTEQTYLIIGTEFNRINNKNYFDIYYPSVGRIGSMDAATFMESDGYLNGLLVVLNAESIRHLTSIPNNYALRNPPNQDEPGEAASSSTVAPIIETRTSSNARSSESGSTSSNTADGSSILSEGGGGSDAHTNSTLDAEEINRQIRASITNYVHTLVRREFAHEETDLDKHRLFQLNIYLGNLMNLYLNGGNTSLVGCRGANFNNDLTPSRARRALTDFTSIGSQLSEGSAAFRHIYDQILVPYITQNYNTWASNIYPNMSSSEIGSWRNFLFTGNLCPRGLSIDIVSSR